MKMKDRVKHTNQKKPSRALFKTMIVALAVTAVFTTLCSLALFHLNSENKMLTDRIDNYATQIDMLENNETQVLRHNPNNND